MKTLNLAFPIVAIAFVGFFVGLGLLYYHYTATVIRFPVIIAGLAVLFAGLVIARILSSERMEEDEVIDAEISRSNLGAFWGACLWLLGILPALYILGFPLGIPAYILAYMKAHGEKWLLSLSMAALGFVVTYVVFMKFLGVPLPATPLEFM